MHTNTEDLCRSSDIPQRLPHLFTENQWAWAFRNRASNGIDKAVTKVGTRYFINVAVLIEILSGSDG
jgi:hypothetical protein